MLVSIRPGPALLSLSLLVSLAACRLLAGEPARDGVRLFYRMLGASRNAPMVPKTRTVLLFEGEERTRSTGMANSGFTEYPFLKGRVSYTFAERFMYFPRIVSGARVDPERTNSGDIVVPHVYEPDACVWGRHAREFAQTFVAGGRELVSVSLLVASTPGSFVATLHEGSPAGLQVGDAHVFTSGHSIEWGWARWRAGEAPLEPGRTYAIRIRREDGEAWRPYLCATGDVYAGGCLWADGRALGDSDLGAWILEETPDISRGRVENADTEGWIYGANAFTFVPRTRNIRLVSIDFSGARDECVEAVLSVSSPGEPDRAIARKKRNVTCARVPGLRSAHFLFTGDELPVEPGTAYRARLSLTRFEREKGTVGDEQDIALDMRPWVYGEVAPGEISAVHNLSVTFPEVKTMEIRWQSTIPAPARLDLRRLSPREERSFEFGPGETVLRLEETWRGHDYELELETEGPSGLRWRTPVYRVRELGGPHPPPPPYLYPEHPEGVFVPLAPPRPPVATSGPIRFLRVVPLANADFEEGLEGWTAEGVSARGEHDGISPPFGRGMAGWTHRAGEQREQVFEKTAVYQSIDAVPGHRYLVSARAHSSVENGPRGDTRVRLFADPRGGKPELDFENSTQWYWTDGEWMRLHHAFTAEAERATVGVGFFRWRDLDRSSAFADRVTVLDLGPRARGAAEAASSPRRIPALALVDHQTDAEETVEALLKAPPGHVITGLGARAAADNLTTMWLRIQPLTPEGRLGEAEQILGGWEPDGGLEAKIELPPSYVATGFGARIAPEWDVKTLAVWGRPLLDDGTLGDEREFRGGIEPRGGLEREVRLEAGRVLTSAGLRCHLNDVKGIRASSARLVKTVSGPGVSKR